MHYYHLLNAVYGHVDNNSHVIKQKGNISNVLKSLVNKGLIAAHTAQEPKLTFYYLTNEGLNLMTDFYEIPINYRGSGFDEDFGFFEYRTYKPPIFSPKGAMHFNFQVWVLSMLQRANNRAELRNRLANIHSPVEKQEVLKSPSEIMKLTAFEHIVPKDDRLSNICTFRDNLHAKIIVSEKNQRANKYKPDCEVILKGNRTYFIEVDSGTERQAHLESKFHRIFDRLKALKEMNLPLPKGVIFVTYDRYSSNRALLNPDNVMTRQTDSVRVRQRYLTIFEVFHKIFKKTFNEDFSLHLMTIEDFEKSIARLATVTPEHQQAQLFKVMKQYAPYLTAQNDIHWQKFKDATFIHHHIAAFNNEFYLFVPIEGYDSSIWYKLKRLHRLASDLIKGKFHIVLAYENHFPYIPFLERAAESFYYDVMVVDIGGHKPYWYNVQRASIHPPFNDMLPPELRID